MTIPANALHSPVKHVFVDYENVRNVALAIFGDRSVHLTLLVGAQKTKLDAALVEELLAHTATVELIRLASSGRNALDFALAYYLGRAVLADPCGHFHIVSKDKGYDALIEHLQSKNIRAHRHDDFSSLISSAVAGAPASALPAKPESIFPAAAQPQPKPKNAATDPELWEAKVLEHLRKPTTKRPGTHQKLVSYLVTHLGNRGTEVEAEKLVEWLGQAGHLVVGEKGKISYRLDQA